MKKCSSNVIDENRSSLQSVYDFVLRTKGIPASEFPLYLINASISVKDELRFSKGYYGGWQNIS